MGVPLAGMQSANDRSSRMDRARGKRIVSPRWYWSVDSERSYSLSDHPDSPDGMISAALTFKIKELIFK